MTTPDDLAQDRADILETLRAHRHFLRYSVRDLTAKQAAHRPTVSELCLGGLIKHVAATEESWVAFILDGPGVLGGGDEATFRRHADSFRMLDGETLEGLLARYAEVALRTDELVASLPDLDADQPLPPAPWFAPGTRRSARRVFLHIIAETAQHAGHADILRESIDGAKTMG